MSAVIKVQSLNAAGAAHPVAQLWKEIGADIAAVTYDGIPAAQWEQVWLGTDQLVAGSGTDLPHTWWLSSKQIARKIPLDQPYSPSLPRATAGFSFGPVPSDLARLAPLLESATPPIDIAIRPDLIIAQLGYHRYVSLARALAPRQITWSATANAGGCSDSISLNGWTSCLAPLSLRPAMGLPADCLYAMALGIDGAALAKALTQSQQEPVIHVLDAIYRSQHQPQRSLAESVSILKGTVVFAIVARPLMPGWCLDFPDDATWQEVVVEPLLKLGFKAGANGRYTMFPDAPFAPITLGHFPGGWRLTSDEQLLDPTSVPNPPWMSTWQGHPLAAHMAVGAFIRYLSFYTALHPANGPLEELAKKSVHALATIPLADADVTADTSVDALTISGNNSILCGAAFAFTGELWRSALSSTIHDFQKKSSTAHLLKALDNPQPRLLTDSDPELLACGIEHEAWGAISGKVPDAPDLPMAAMNPELGFGCTVWMDSAGNIEHSDGDRGQHLWKSVQQMVALGHPPTATDWAPLMKERRRLRFGEPTIFAEQNFEMSSLPSGWQMSRMDKSKFDTSGIAQWTSPDHRTTIRIYSTKGDRDTAESTTLLQEKFIARLQENNPHQKITKTIRGIDGFAACNLQMKVREKNDESEIQFAIITHQGWIWQIMALAEAHAHTPASEAMALAGERFGVSNRALASPALQHMHAATVESHPTLPVTLQFIGSDWQILESTAQLNNAASLAFQNPAYHTWATLFAADLANRTCSEHALMAGILAQMEQPYVTAIAGGERRCRLLDQNALEVSFFRGTTPRVRMTVRTTSIAGMAFGVVMWRAGDEDPPSEAVESFLSALRPTPEIAKPFRETTSTFENAVANWYVAKSLPQDAWTWAESHARAHAGSAESIGRALRILSTQERWQDALSWYLANAAQLAPDDMTIASWEPWLQFKTGHIDQALAQYEKLFDRGYVSTDDFELFVTHVHTHRSPAEAYLAFRRWAKMGDASDGRRLHAHLLHSDGRDEEALAWLTTLGESHQDIDLLDQADCLIALEHYMGAHDILSRFLRSHPGSQRGWRLAGISEYRLGWYKDALHSFDRTLEIGPTDESAKTWKKNTQQALGRGDNQLLQQEIPAITLPAAHNATAAPPAMAEKGPRWLLYENLISWHTDEEFVHTRHRVLQVTDQAACEHFSTLEIPFDTEIENLYINNLWIIAPDGTRKAALRREDCYLIEVPNAVAGGGRIARIPVPGLVPGSILEWIYTTRKEHAHTCWLQVPLPEQAPCDAAQISLQGDISLLTVATRGQWTAEEVAGARIYRHGPLKAARGNVFVDPADGDLPRIIIGEKTATWNHLGLAYLKELQNVLATSPQVHDLANQWLPVPRGREQDADLILRQVSQRLSYSAVAFGVSARIPHLVGDVIERAQGDCKDHSLLMWHLLRDRGYVAFLALANATTRTITDDLPSLEQFNHMVVCLVDEHGIVDRVLDATADHQEPHLHVPSGLGGATLLLLDPAGPRLVTAPAHEMSEIRTDRQVRIAEDGRLTVIDDVIFTGYYGGFIRNRFTDHRPDEQLEQTQYLYEKSASKVEHVTIDNADDSTRPVALHLTWTPKVRLSNGGGTLSGILPDHAAEWLIRTAPEPGRTRPFMLRWPIKITTTTHLDPPPGWTLETPHVLPDSSDVWFDWRGTVHGNTLQVTLDQHVGTWPVEQFATWVSKCHQMVDRNAMEIRIKKNN